MPETAPRADADEVQMTDPPPASRIARTAAQWLERFVAWDVPGGLTPPPAFDENREDILRDWLG